MNNTSGQHRCSIGMTILPTSVSDGMYSGPDELHVIFEGCLGQILIDSLVVQYEDSLNRLDVRETPQYLTTILIFDKMF
jgi:hypothetical protein